MNRYLCRATRTKWIEAENEQEALEKFKDVEEDITIRCVGKAPTEFERRAALSQGESSYLDQGITPGIV